MSPPRDKNGEKICVGSVILSRKGDNKIIIKQVYKIGDSHVFCHMPDNRHGNISGIGPSEITREALAKYWQII